MEEKRGPVEKTSKGWPINPFGVIALLIFALIIIFLIVKPLLQQKTVITQEQTNSPGGQIVSPLAGDIIRTPSVPIELKVDNPQDIQKVQFWIKTYSDGKWQMIGEDQDLLYKFDWQIPSEFQNKAVAITAHIYKKSGDIVKDPGGWREGIIILAQ